MYEIEEKINEFDMKLVGTGSYASVYKYKDSLYDCYFAIKKLKKSITGKEKERFKHEYELLSRYNYPNILKVYYGEMEKPNEDIVVMETNIDDCTGELLGYTEELLFNNRALDVFFTPIYMKKNRPAVMLSCLCKTEDRDKFTDLMFKHTTTRGVRYADYARAKLNSAFEEIHTDAGIVRRKISTGKNVVKAKLEFEDLRKIADALDLSIEDVRKLVRD